MGALTDSRKRLSADHRLLPSFPPSPPPPSKKPKLSPIPSSFSPSSHLPSSSSSSASASAAAEPGPSSSSSLPHRHRRLPPPPPHARPIHGPQRVVRAFGLGSTRFHLNPLRFPPSSPSSPSPPPPWRSPGLEQYVELVNSVAHAPPPPPPTCSADAPTRVEVITVQDEEERKDDADEQDEEEEANRIVGRRVPLYKELYEASSRRRDAKLRTLDFEVRLAEKGRLGLEELADVLKQFAPKKEEVPGPFVPLTDEDEDNVDRALGGRNRRERLVIHEPSNIVITREILQCLNERDWLNDEVINLYLDLLKERELREPSKFLKCHFFNTFFYKKLITGGYDYKSVRRWTTKRKLGYNLIDCDKARYVVDEVKDKSGQHIDTSSWKQEGVKNLALQENGWDCGMFMLKYIDFYSRDMDLIFGQDFHNCSNKTLVTPHAAVPLKMIKTSMGLVRKCTSCSGGEEEEEGSDDSGCRLALSQVRRLALRLPLNPPSPSRRT
uniref:Ubiquitin-like protease family profile domain-containing protein n=1 Tax=Leersia perrieri TaxID=77586 RepID=A0A0D9V0R5_9ORYZ